MGVTAWVSGSHLDRDLSGLACHPEALRAIVAVFPSEGKALHSWWKRNGLLVLSQTGKRGLCPTMEEAALLPPSPPPCYNAV